MKKLICMILALAMLAGLTGCGKKETVVRPGELSETVETLPDATTDSTGETVTGNLGAGDFEIDPSHEFHLPTTVTCNVVTEESLITEDSEMTFTLTYTDVVLATDDLNVDMNVKTDLDKDMNSVWQTADEIHQSMIDMVDAGEELPGSGFVSNVLVPERMDTNVISFSGRISTYYPGGIHPNTILKGMNYSGTSGMRLALREVLTSESKVNDVKAMVLDKLAAMDAAEPGQFFDEYPDAVEAHFDPENTDNENWILNKDGMLFYFSAYDLAPYAAGPIEVQLTYAELSGILMEEYLPVASDVKADGEISANPETEGAPSYIVVSSWDGETVDLITDGTVTDLRIEAVSSYDGETFFTDGTLFAANYLEGGKVVRLMDDIPDTMPNVRITYTGKSGQVVRYLSQSGQDGSFLLLEL